MARRQRRHRKIKLPAFLKDAGDFALRKVVIISVAVLFAAAAFFLVRAFVYSSGYFNLRMVETRCRFLDHKTTSFISGQLIALYKGRNIFRLDLKSIDRSIRDAYPDAKTVSVRLAPPDKLVVDLIYRRPIALVKSGKLYAVDDEGVILSSVDTAPLEGLPVIEGVNVRYAGKRLKPASRKGLDLALELLSDMRGFKRVMAEKPVTVNAGKIANLSFYFRNGVEVRIGCENFKERLGILESTLKDPRLLMDRIRYIDVRFEEVVIGPKE